MGSFVFRWPNQAKEVWVTGSFDDWKRSIKLDLEDGVFSRQVDLPSSEHKVYYKFIVDGAWAFDKSAPIEDDPLGNTNNVLLPSQIQPIPAGGRSHHAQHSTPNSATAVMSGIGPGSSSAQMAGQVPLEKDRDLEDRDKEMPGGFPEDFKTPEEEPSSFMGSRTAAQHPAGIGYEGSNSREPPGEQQFGISPLPGTAGPGNPISLKPGEPIPSSGLTTRDAINSNVKLDKASYERSDALPTAATAGGLAGGTALATGAFGVPPVTNSNIPESGLPMGGEKIDTMDSGPTISSSAGQTTSTAALAAKVPLEPRGVPEVVRESQGQSPDSPNASKDKDMVMDKHEVEDELKAKIPEQPATSESHKGTIAAATASGVAVIGGAAAAASSYLPTSVQKAISDMNSGKNPLSSDATPAANQKAASNVPDTVADSIKLSDETPEAAANPLAVANKKGMESELRREVPRSEESGDPPPTTSAALSPTAPGDGPSKLPVSSNTEPQPATQHPNIASAGATTVTAATAATAAAIVGQHGTSNTTAGVRESAIDPILTKQPGPPLPTATSVNPVEERDGPTIADENTMPAIIAGAAIPGAGAATAVSSAGPSSALNSGSAKSPPSGPLPEIPKKVDAFADDPIGVSNISPVVTDKDPRKVAEAFATDPISANDITSSVNPVGAKTGQASASNTGTASVTQKAAMANAAGAGAATTTRDAPLPDKPFSDRQRLESRDISPFSKDHPRGTADTTGSKDTALGAATAGSAANTTKTTTATTSGPQVTTGTETTGATEKQKGWQDTANAPQPRTPTKQGTASAGPSAASSPAAATTTSSAAEKEKKKKKRTSFLGRLKEKFSPHHGDKSQTS